MNFPIHISRIYMLSVVVWIGGFFFAHGQSLSTLPHWIEDHSTNRGANLFSVSDPRQSKESGQVEAVFRAAAFAALLDRSFYSRTLDVYNEQTVTKSKRSKRLVKTMVALFADFDTLNICATSVFTNRYGETFACCSSRFHEQKEKRYRVEVVVFRELLTKHLKNGRIDWSIKEIATGRIVDQLTIYQCGSSIEIRKNDSDSDEFDNGIINRYPNNVMLMEEDARVSESTFASLGRGLFQAALRSFADALFSTFDESFEVKQKQTHSNMGSQKLIDIQSIKEHVSIEVTNAVINDNKLAIYIKLVTPEIKID